MSTPVDPVRWQLLASHVPADGQGGGMVRYVVELASALSRREDVELLVLTAPAAVPFFSDLLSSPQRVHALPKAPTVGNALIERYFVRSAGGPFDVVQGAKHLVPRRSPAMRVLTVHDMVLYDRPQDFGPVKRTLLRRPYLASIADADVIICVSEATRERLVSQLPLTRPRTTVVPNAVSTTLLGSVPCTIPALVGKAFAIVVGDASQRKNLPLLVDCWDRVCERVPEAVLAIAGPPDWAGSSHGESFARLTAEGKVVALGSIPDEALRWCYEQAAVALCPSLLEGFGLPAVEALAFQAPLITSTDAALTEVSGDRALHLPGDRAEPWVDAISAALAGGRRPTAPFPVRTWDEVAEETVDAIRSARVAAP